MQQYQRTPTPAAGGGILNYGARVPLPLRPPTGSHILTNRGGCRCDFQYSAGGIPLSIHPRRGTLTRSCIKKTNWIGKGKGNPQPLFRLRIRPFMKIPFTKGSTGREDTFFGNNFITSTRVSTRFCYSVIHTLP